MNPFLENISLNQNSLAKFSYFFKIEEIQVSMFVSLIKEINAKYFIDIGSNVGFYSLLAASFTSVDEIFAFEPTLDTFSELDSNIKKNPSFPISIKNLALSDCISSTEFSDFGGMSGKNGIISTSFHNTSIANTVTINTDLLDNIFDYKNEIIALKIDTEGHEFSILKGGVEMLMKNNCVIQVELGHGNHSDDISEYLKLMDYFEIIKLGPDSYFSNIEYLKNTKNSFDILNKSLNFVIDNRWK